MNDKDKEAFEKFMGENLPFSYYEYYSCPDIDAWKAACEHKQKEIDKLKSTLIYLYDWYGRFMPDTTIDKIIKAVEGEK